MLGIVLANSCMKVLSWALSRERDPSVSCLLKSLLVSARTWASLCVATRGWPQVVSGSEKDGKRLRSSARRAAWPAGAVRLPDARWLPRHSCSSQWCAAHRLEASFELSLKSYFLLVGFLPPRPPPADRNRPPSSTHHRHGGLVAALSLSD
eukprot:SAG31_NODE_1411_length_8466_cov_18.216565_6_plen_151_part_00